MNTERRSPTRPSRGLCTPVALAAALVALAGCDPAINLVPDGGVMDAGAVVPDAEPASDAAARDATEGSADAAAEDAGLGAPDAGPARPDAGGIAELGWALMPLPQRTTTVTTIHGRASGGQASELFAGTVDGRLLQYTRALGWKLHPWSAPNNAGIRGIYATAARLYVADEANLHVFNLPTTPSVSLPVGRSIRRIWGVSDTEIYLVADQPNGRGLYLYDGRAIRTLNEPTDVAELTAIHQTATLETYVGGNAMLYRYGFNTLTPELVDWPAAMSPSDIARFEFHAIGNVGSQLFAAGSQNLVLRREQSGRWAPQYAPFVAEGKLRRVVGFDNRADPEGYAVGDANSQGSILRYYKNQWAPAGFTMDVDLLDLWATGANEYYAVGGVNNGLDGVILSGTR